MNTTLLPARARAWANWLSLLIGAAALFAAPATSAAAGPSAEDLTACTGAPSYPCGGANVGGWESWWEWIERVQIDAIDKSSFKNQYAFFDDAGPAVLKSGEKVRVQLTPGLSWGGYQTNLFWAVYIDYNRDGDFDDAGEAVLRTSGNRKAVDQEITIPGGIQAGCTRIRVTVQRDKYAGPCENFSFGEVEDYLAVLMPGTVAPPPPPAKEVCADRTATNNVECAKGISYGFFGDFVRGVTGDTDYFTVSNGRFAEFTDGTARYVARLTNNGVAGVAFDLVVNFSGRTEADPAGSPKEPLCGPKLTGEDFYYYTNATGTLTGLHLVAGARLNLTRKGEAFQVGKGANGNEANVFGASGWFVYTVASQPNNHVTIVPDAVVDINVRLSGGRDLCFPPAATKVTLTCPADQTFQVAAGQSHVTVGFPVPTASTTCAKGGLVLTKVSGIDPGSAQGPGTYTVTYRAQDACGNTETCSFKVVVKPAPVVGSKITLVCPANITAPQIADYGADVFIPQPTASTTCAQGGLVLTYSPALPANRTPHFPVGTTTVTVTAKDACGNTSTCTFSVTVTPRGGGGGGGGGGDCTGTGPNYPCGGANVGGWEPWQQWIGRVQFGSIDNTSFKDAYKFFSNVSPAQVSTGQTLTLTVTPGLSWSGQITNLYYTAFVDWNGDGDFDDAQEAVLRQNAVSKGVTVQVTVPAFAKTGVTRLRVALQVDKYAGACESFSVGEVEDYLVCVGGGTTPPPATRITLTCPADITAPQIADYGADVFIPQPTASTTCPKGGLVLTYNPALPANRTPHFPVGTTVVTVTAKDACGNVETCTFKVIVTPRPVNNGKITLTCPADITAPQIADYGADVFIPQPTASTTCPQGGLVLTYNPALPANRTPHFPVGTTVVTVTAKDACGNVETCTFKVIVTPRPVNNGKITLTCPADITAPQIADYGADVFIPQPTASTTCPKGGLVLTYSPALPANRTPHFPVGTTVVTVTAKDACGNVETCTFKVIVTPRPVNNGKITLTCPADQTFQIAAGEQHATVNYAIATASTTCPKGGLHLAQTAGPARGSRQGAGTYTVTYTATDACGNSETCTFKVTVKAAPAPADKCDDRSKDGLIALYDFETGSGTTVFDRSGFGTPLNLHLDLGKVSWLNGTCGVEVKAHTIIQSATSAEKVIKAVKQTNEITLEAWVQTSNLWQRGPARIVTISENPLLRNVTLGQDDTEYITRLRTTHTDHNGLPELSTGHGKVKSQVQHVVYTRNSAGHERFYVDGELVKTGTRGGDFGNWAEYNRLILVNEASGDRPWLGKLFKVAIYKRDLSAAEVTKHYQVGACCEAPTPPPASDCDKDILFVVGNSALNSGDKAVKDKLVSYGYHVTIKNQHEVHTSDADGKGLVIISSTNNSSTIGSKFTHVATPVLTWEAYLYDDLKMTGPTAEVDYGGGWGYTKLVAKTDHPINRDLGGTRTVVTSTEDFRYGKPSAAATVVAVAEGMHDKPVIFAYEAGAHMVGKTAPGRRIGWFFDDDTADKLNAHGWLYFRNAVDWATGCTSTGLRIETPVQLFADANYEAIALKWSATLRDGEDAFSLQRQDERGAWVELGQFAADSRQPGVTTLRAADESPVLGVNRYRVVATSPQGERESNVAEAVFTASGEITVYPNPASETASVVLKGLAGFDVDVQVINALGQTMLRRKVEDATEAPYALEVGHLPEGSYIVHVQTKAVRYSVPLVLVK